MIGDASPGGIMKKTLFSTVFAVLMCLMILTPVHADGIIIPDPPIPPEPWVRPMAQLIIKYHHVSVTIENQIAVTHVDQVFYNPNNWPIEGNYLFPLPIDAVVSDFSLWIDGKPVKGEVLDAAEARQTYESIVWEMKDPALLEYTDRGAYQASIFPIPPEAERRIELEYSQVLTSENGLVRYVYPLNTEKFSAQPLQSVKVSLKIEANEPIRAAYSPTHLVDILKESDLSILVGYEEEDVLPNKDFALYYSIGESEAIHVFSFRDPKDPVDEDGFFMMLLAPSPRVEAKAIPKDVLIVLDRSGSMEGEKFKQAQDALKYILTHLNPDDRFYITAFSTGIDTFSNDLQPNTASTDALKWVDSLSPSGSTDIHRALLETVSVADAERPTYLIFLTDGLATEGITESQVILTNFQKNANNNIRLFTFGVGYDVDTFLLDSLSQAHHGLSTYVQPGEHLDEVLSAFYARISTPVLTNTSLDFDDLPVYDLYPQPLPDLFAGTQVVVVGRYREGGIVDMKLQGDVNGESQEFTFPDQAFAIDNRSESDILSSLPRLWATRKIGYLLSSIRLNGPNQETIDQIVQLSIRYGIVTPYTSYLITEPMPLGASNQQELSRDVYEEALAAPVEVAGQQAVEKAVDEGDLYQANIAPTLSQDYSAVKTVWSRTFVLREGIWLDSAYDPDQMKINKLNFLSDEYFQFSRLRPDIAAALALGNQVILVVDGIAYEITPNEATDELFVMPESKEPAAGNQPDISSPEQNNGTTVIDVEDQTTTGIPETTNNPAILPRTVYLYAITGAAIAVLLTFIFLGIRWLKRTK